MRGSVGHGSELVDREDLDLEADDDDYSDPFPSLLKEHGRRILQKERS